MKQLFYLVLATFFCIPLLAQGPPSTEEAYDKAYKMRISQETINGVYIPASLPEAFVELHRLIDKTSLQKFKSVDEDEAVKKLHFSFGRWMIINWGFYEGSRLSHSLKAKGLHHPDDMAQCIIRAFHRSLNKKPIEAEAIITDLVETREKQRIERLQQGTILYEEKRTGN
jgi:hypothetical protein